MLRTQQPRVASGCSLLRSEFTLQSSKSSEHKDTSCRPLDNNTPCCPPDSLEPPGGPPRTKKPRPSEAPGPPEKENKNGKKKTKSEGRGTPPHQEPQRITISKRNYRRLSSTEKNCSTSCTNKSNKYSTKPCNQNQIFHPQYQQVQQRESNPQACK